MFKIFFDLDGTLADFEGSGGISKMWKKGFFQNLVPYPNGLEIVKSLYDAGHEIFVLSACINSKYCKAEKMEWIGKYLPFVKNENIHLIPTGSSKAEYAESLYGKLDKNCILFDDYKTNLYEWRNAGGSAIKCGKQYKDRPYPQVIKWNMALWEVRK